jgi:putative membrane protein
MKASFSTLAWVCSFILLGLALSCNSNKPGTSKDNDTTVSENLKNAGNDLKNAANAAGEEIKNTTDTAIKNIENALSDRNPDSVFIVKVVLSNNKELEMLKAGMDKGTLKTLKNDAKMMRADHMKLGETIKKYAAQKGYTIPTGDDGKADIDLNKISTETGNDWDKAWTDDMIDDHNDAISTFEKYQDKVNAAALKSIISNTLPTLHTHLQMVQTLKEKLNK